jgi:hypothetical protein
LTFPYGENGNQTRGSQKWKRPPAVVVGVVVVVMDAFEPDEYHIFVAVA